jgi:hypothetical protein
MKDLLALHGTHIQSRQRQYCNGFAARRYKFDFQGVTVLIAMNHRADIAGLKSMFGNVMGKGN